MIVTSENKLIKERSVDDSSNYMTFLNAEESRII